MPNQINDINLYDSWKRNVIVLFTIPLILLGCIYIGYGEFFDALLADHNLSETSIYQLNTQLSFFQNEISDAHEIIRLPEIVRNIGYNSVIAVYILLILWLISFSVSSYVKLTLGKGSKLLMLLELAFMTLVFTYSIKPGLSVVLYTLGYLLLFIFLLILVIYWLEAIKYRR